MRIKLIATTFLFCLIIGHALTAKAQGVSVSGIAIVNTPTSVSGIPGNTVLQAVPNAQITVCSSSGGGIPCSPLITIYSNAALTIVASNPFTADINGNFQFFVAPNATGYLYSQTGSGIVGQLFTILPQTNVSSTFFTFSTSTPYTNSTMVPSNIPGLAVPVAVNTGYAIRCTIFYQASVSTAGLNISIVGPGSPTFVISNYTEYSGTTLQSAGGGYSTFGGLATVIAGNPNKVQVDIGLQNGANPGTVQIQGAATGAGTVTVFQNSFCIAL